MDAILETAFNDQTGDWAPISNWTQQTLALKGQLPDIEAKMVAGGLIFYPFLSSFPAIFCRADLAVVTALSQELEETADERRLFFFPLVGIFLLCRFSEAGHGCIGCLAI